MANSFPRDRDRDRDSRGRGEPYYYNHNLLQQQQEQQQQQQSESGYPDSGANPRNSIFQQNNAAHAFSQRTGRLFRPLPHQAGQLYYPPSPSQLNENYPRLGPGLENPFVLATLIAGMAGITLTIIIMASIWILRNSAQKKKQAALVRKTRSNYKPAEGDDAGPGNGATDSKRDPRTELISELKEQQTEKQTKGKFSFYKPRANNKGNILSKKPKNIVIENKSAADAASPEPDSVPICTSEVSGTIIAYEKTMAVGNQDTAPVRVLKETFV